MYCRAFSRDGNNLVSFHFALHNTEVIVTVLNELVRNGGRGRESQHGANSVKQYGCMASAVYTEYVYKVVCFVGFFFFFQALSNA